MKNLLKILISFFAFCFFSFAIITPLKMAGNWYQQFMPNIGGQQINDITFLDSLTGFAISSRNVNPDTASILKTTNGGDNWQIVFSQGSRRFSRVMFVNSLTGFITGGSGSGTPYLYKTTDGGTNWNTVTGATLGNSYWNDMSVLNADTIWLVDANSLNGGVYRTTNGGTNWTQQLNLGSQNPSKIYMYNARIGFFSSTAGLYKTTNSGLNWFNASSDFSFSDMFFTDSLTGWKASGFIKKTTNGGINWVTQPIPQGGNILGNGAIRFMNKDNDTIWAVGESIIVSGSPPTRGILFRTINGGNTWQFQVPDTAIHINRYFFGQFINNRVGWGYSFNPTGIHTTNGGDTGFITALSQISYQVPEQYYLYQNFPNPFNPTTNIKYQIVNSNSYVKLTVYDITGKELKILVNEQQNPGIYLVDFNGNDLATGIYFYSLVSMSSKGTYKNTKKMLMVK